MARQIKWRLQFKSQNGTGCLVNIYEEGYTGSSADTTKTGANVPFAVESGVTALNGASDPFEYNEGDSEDLLNDIIRYRTGYIRVVEDNFGDLDEIFPSINTDRYVEFYYGDTLDFVGYIQAQAFDNEWAPGPRIVELPVISPLGLASGINIDFTYNDSPSWWNMRTIIRKTLSQLNGGYTGWYFPKFMPSVSGQALTLEGLFLNSLVIAPWSGEYDKSSAMSASNSIYSPKTLEEVLTIICTGFGLILHDVPTAPVFQRVDFKGDYLLFPMSGNISTATVSVTDITSIASVASANNVISKVMPLSKIDVEYEGSESIPEMTFDRCRGYSRPCAITDREFCTNTPNISDLRGTFPYLQGIRSDGLLENPDPNSSPSNIVCLGAYGQDNLSEMILYQVGSIGLLIGSYTFYEWNGETVRLQFKHMYGTSIENMRNEQYGSFTTVIAVRVTTDGKYYSTQNGWQAIGGSIVYTKSWVNGEVDCEVGIGAYNNGTTPGPLTIEFYTGSGQFYQLIQSISDVNLLRYQYANEMYLYKNRDKNRYTIKGSASDVNGSLSRGCGQFAENSNRIRFSSSVSGTATTELANNEPRYPHLLTAQDRITIDMKMTYQTAAVIYLNRITLWNSSGKWRTIARSFQPWNDLHLMTFHHSSIFDY